MKFLLEKLNKHPHLKNNEIFEIAENSSEELVTADNRAIKAIEEVRKLGQSLDPT